MIRAALVLLLLAAAPACAEVLVGKVVGVTDGDTLTLLTSETRQLKVRLAGIDTPERGQPFGARAKDALSVLAFGKQAAVHTDKLDRYGRVVGKVVVDGQDVCLELLRQGMAWWYRKYADEQSPKDREAYRAAEAEAREANRGLWGDDGPVPPWQWRRH